MGLSIYHMVVHNQSFRSTDCASKLIKNFFEPKYACARTKSQVVVTNVFRKESLTLLQSYLQIINCITIYSDCSNHGNIKICPI